MHESEKWKWSHSVVFDSFRPHGLQPTRLLGPWDFPGKRTGVGAKPSLWPTSVGHFFFFFNFWSFVFSFPREVKSLSHVRLFATPWTVAYQAPPSMGFSRQEYWSGLLLELLTIFQFRYSLSASIQHRTGPKLSNSSKGWRTVFLLPFLTWSLDGVFGTQFSHPGHTLFRAQRRHKVE